MNAKCPNIDPDTYNGLRKLGVSMDVHNRQILFYTLCIVLRLFLAGVAYQLKDTLWFPYIVIVISLFIMYRLHDKLEGNFWWSRKFHFIVCLLLVIVSLLKIVGVLAGEYISYLLYLDVGVGFFHSLMIKRC